MSRQSACIKSKMVVFGQGSCIGIKMVVFG